MLLIEREIELPFIKSDGSLLDYFRKAISTHIGASEIPVRFAVTQSDDSGYHCEIGVLSVEENIEAPVVESIFEFNRRMYENTDKFNAVCIIPTGIGTELGGHAGDAGPVARLLSGVCDRLVTHPNVVNASDINELPENALYVEGSVISQLLMGTVGLQQARANRVMVVVDAHNEKQIADATINSVSAARSALGMECPRVVTLEPPIKMRARYSTSGSAVGRVEGLENLCSVLDDYRGEYDAVALASVIDVPSEFHTSYFESNGSMVNPWGGVEAMLTHAVTMLYGIPTAHSPMFESMKIANLDVGVVDPRMAAEAVSTCFLHCILKGLHRSPQIIKDTSLFGHAGVLSAADISCLVMPDHCVGLPTLAAMEQGIPVIAVRENKNRMENKLEELGFADGKLIVVDNYLEAAGVMTALKEGVALSSVRRPLGHTRVIKNEAAKQARNTRTLSH